MNRILTVAAASLALIAVGCEEKKDGKSIVDQATSKVSDAAKGAGDAVTDAANKAKDGMAGQLDELMKGGQGAMTDKLNGMLTEWKPTVEKIKGAIATAAPDMKPQIEAAVKGIEDQWKNVEGLLGKLKGASATDLKSVAGDAFGGAEKLGTMITEAAAKFVK
ncbi:MAG: hypothetical protein ACKVZJ_14545 [Phycisphaerales bacterium]